MAQGCRASEAFTESERWPLGGVVWDLAKYYARHLERLGRVKDGSDPDERIAPGYCIFQAFIRVGTWQMLPLVMEPLKVYAGAPTGRTPRFCRTVADP